MTTCLSVINLNLECFLSVVRIKGLSGIDGGRMRFLILILLSGFFLVPGQLQAAENPAVWAGPDQLIMERQSPVVDVALSSLFSAASERQSFAVWVFFTDKGISNRAELQDRLASARDGLTPEAYSRRAKTRGKSGLVDFRDLAVEPDYIEKVLETGAKLRHVLRWFNAVTVEATPGQMDDLASLPFVRYIKSVAYSTTNLDLGLDPASPDMTLVTLDYGPSQGQLEQINVISAHELGFKGQGVIVCMMDTGYRQGHDAFQNIINSGRLIAQYDFINHDDDTDYDENQDSSGQPNHGTVTWSTLGGEAEGHLYGPAYLASFVLSKSEDISSERHIEEDNWAAGAEWADSIGASVISASLGYRDFDQGEGDYSYEDLDGNTTIVTVAADLAAYNGIAVATAMGNEGNYPGSLIAPADGDSVISCGAVDANGYLASFSSWGPTSDGRTKPEVCAQGVSTVCVDPNNIHGYTSSGGTSLSTPLIGGSCAVLLSAHPNWTPMMVREALMMTADRRDGPDIDYGWGIADVGTALYYHPEGDIVFEHRPDIMLRSGRAIPIALEIASNISIENAYLYYRLGDSGDFTQQVMTTSDGIHFDGQIPGQSNGILQYYFEAVDANGSYAFDPLGGEAHPYSFVLNNEYLEDSFEAGIQLWRSGGIHNRWGLTTEYARTGNLSIADSPITYYDNDTDSWLESTFSLDLSQALSAEVSFFYRGVLQTDLDFLYLEVSTDGGASWEAFPEAINGSEFSFVEYAAGLDAYIGNPDVRIRFHLVASSSGEREGIFIDDVTITWQQTGTDEDNYPVPHVFSLSQNYPNPFNPSTSILFSLDSGGEASLVIYDLMGRQVRTLVSSILDAGEHEIIWDGRDGSGDEVASGIYLYRLQSNGSSRVRRMTLLR